MSSRPLPCVVCGESPDRHHHYEPVKLPVGCGCDPREWIDQYRIPDICPLFAVGPNYGGEVCETCQHEKGCHK